MENPLLPPVPPSKRKRDRKKKLENLTPAVSSSAVTLIQPERKKRSGPHAPKANTEKAGTSARALTAPAGVEGQDGAVQNAAAPSLAMPNMPLAGEIKPSSPIPTHSAMELDPRVPDDAVPSAVIADETASTPVPLVATMAPGESEISVPDPVSPSSGSEESEKLPPNSPAGATETEQAEAPAPTPSATANEFIASEKPAPEAASAAEVVVVHPPVKPFLPKEVVVRPCHSEIASVTKKGDGTIMSKNLEKAREIARSKAYWAAGLGLIPNPGINVLSTTAIQLKMLSEIAEVYGTRLSNDLAKSVLSALLGGIGSTAAGYGALGVAMSAVPLVGPVLGFATMPIAAGATTYAVGAVFANAFETKNPALLDGSNPATKEVLHAELANAPA